MNWEKYSEYRLGAKHTVSGDIQALSNVYSPQFDNRRDLLVYLPPSYAASEKRYPVIYMQDGQNIFDAETSFAGEWHVDETMEDLARKHLEAIVVGIPNTGNFRITEYNPFHHPRFGEGRGQEYIDFVTNTIKPLIDDSFKTKTEAKYTGIMGSSMGGLISLYGFLYRPDVFGLVGSMSPSLWLGYNQLLAIINQYDSINGKIYLDIGEKELSTHRDATTQRPKHNHSQRYANNVNQIGQILQKKLMQKKGYKFVCDPDGTHSEASWSRRLPTALKFLLTDL